MVKLISISKSNRYNKKLMAQFLINDKLKITHFCADGYDDYTIHKDEKRKELYIKRHQKKEDWNNPTTAGALSRWILWNKPTLIESIKDYKNKFGFK